MKQILKWLIKAIAAGAAAFVCMSFFCYFYYNLPAHHTTENGTTDHSWSEFHFTSRGSEGFASTKTDENGYVNTFPYKKDNADILLMGSSHTEGFNVNYNQNFAYLLNKKLYDGGFDMYAYNIGMSSHSIGRCLNNLDRALNAYPSAKYVVIETHSERVALPLMEQMISDTYEPITVGNSGLVHHLQELDYLRLLYAQLKHMTKTAREAVPEEVDPEHYASCLDQVIEQVEEIGKEHDCTVVILYSPFLSVDYAGEIIPPAPSDELDLLQSTCQKYGVEFITAQEAYEDMYRQTNHLPHGFVNTAVGTGHMNRYGHACIADVLFDYVTKED